MRATLISAMVCGGLLTAFSAPAQDLQGFEMPKQLEGKLGEKKCPPGTVRDEQGWCRRPPVRRPPLVAPPEPKPSPTAPPPAAAAPAVPPAAPQTAPPAGPEQPEKTSPGQLPEGGAPAPAPGAATTAAAPADSPGEAAGADAEQAATAEATGGAAEAAEPEHEFVKGELADFIGANKLVTKNNRVGVRLGYRKIDLKHYITINPEADFRIWRFQLGLGVPLALELFDGTWDEAKGEPVGFADAGSFRREDWNEPGEFLRFIRYLRLGRKEERVFLNLSQYSSMTLGHGPLMRRYNVNIDPDATRLAFELDMYNDYAGFELVSNSLVDWDLFGVLGFVKPLSLFLDGTVARSLSLGVTYLADRHAPVTLATQQEPSANPFFLLGKDQPQVTSSAWLHALGVDMEIKVVKTRSVDIKPYVDYSWFMPQSPSGNNPPQVEGGGGFTLGVLGRFNFGSNPVQALRAIAEFRSFSATYLPGYFDTFYEVQKFVANSRYRDYAKSGGLPPPKFSEVFVARRGEGRHLGFYLELTYSLVNWLAATVALEGSDARAGNNFLAHLEVSALKWLQFFASYHQRGADSLGELFSSGGDRLLFAALRLRALPFLFFNFRYYYSFELRDDFADLTGDGFEEHYRFYEAMHGWLADVELGWEF